MNHFSEMDGVKIRVERTRGRCNIRVSVQPGGVVSVYVNNRTSEREIRRIVQQKRDWIIKTIQAIDSKVKIHRYDSPERRSAAKSLLSDLVMKFANYHGFQVNKITIRNQKSRWGSCSLKNNINLNMQLIQLPTSLRDYVIFHELVHTRYHNHSRQFWSELEKYVPEARVKQKELNDYLLVE